MLHSSHRFAIACAVTAGTASTFIAPAVAQSSHRGADARMIRVGVDTAIVEIGPPAARLRLGEEVQTAIAGRLKGLMVDAVALDTRTLNARVNLEANNVTFLLGAAITQQPSAATHRGGSKEKAHPVDGLGRLSLAERFGLAAKANDEVTLRYRLIGRDHRIPVEARLLSRKVEWDGQDVVTPLLEEMSRAVLNTLAVGRTATRTHR
jgi:hypothetical protein